MTLRTTSSDEDIPKVYDLLEAFAREAGLKPDTLDRGNFFAQWSAMQGINSAFLVLLEVDGRVVGALGAVVHPAVYWDWKVASETFLFIHPEFRSGTAAVRLVRAFEAEAKTRGCRQVYAGHKVYFQASSMRRLYGMLGYTEKEVIYVKEI